MEEAKVAGSTTSSTATSLEDDIEVIKEDEDKESEGFQIALEGTPSSGKSLPAISFKISPFNMLLSADGCHSPNQIKTEQLVKPQRISMLSKKVKGNEWNCTNSIGAIRGMQDT